MSILKSPNKKILLEGSFCNFNNNGEIKSFVKPFIRNAGFLYMQPTITLIDFEQITTIKADSVFHG